jgi:hypothetical protein
LPAAIKREANSYRDGTITGERRRKREKERSRDREQIKEKRERDRREEQIESRERGEKTNKRRKERVERRDRERKKSEIRGEVHTKVVVDAIDLVLGEELRERVAELQSRRQIASERLFDHDSVPAVLQVSIYHTHTPQSERR